MWRPGCAALFQVASIENFSIVSAMQNLLLPDKIQAAARRLAGTLLCCTGLVLLTGSEVLSADQADPDSFGPALSSGAAKPVAPSRYSGSKEAKKPRAARGAFNMGQAVRHALDYNPTLGAAEAGARASEAGKKSAMGQLFPSLSTTYGYSYSRQDRDPSMMTGTKTPSNGTYTWSIEVKQILFDGMKTLGTYQKQALQAESDRASLRKSELETTAQVQQQFVSYLCSLQNVHSQEESVARLKEQLEITSAYHDVGLRPKLDVLQAQVDLGEAERELITLKNSSETSLAKLNTLLGLSAEDRVRYEGLLVTPAFKMSLESCLELAYKRRPDLYIAYKAVEMAIKDRLIARSGYYPKIEAYYGITNSGNTPDMQRAGDNASRTTTWEVGATLSWDVFQWGTTYFSDQQAGWLVAKARSQARGIMLDAGYDVKEKYLALREAGKRIEVAKTTVAQAREAYEAALAQYQEQVGTNFDVLDASTKLLNAEVQLTQARGDYLTALSNLYAAMGEFHPDLL